MGKVSKFIPMEIDSEILGGNVEAEMGNAGTVGNGGETAGGNSFKVCGTGTNLPAKPSMWSKLKGILTYEVKVELTPYQQKVEDEINEFLHKEITWQGFKNFLFQEISFGKKNKAK